MAHPNLDPQTIYELFCADFESAWDTLAGTSPDVVTGRGNFMFARSAMGLLEFASRLCADDGSGAALQAFSSELKKVEQRYFASLRARGARPGIHRGVVQWTLPNDGDPESELLGLLFTLVRHGQAHQGQQTMATLTDGSTLGVSLSGVLEKTLAQTKAAPPSQWHLRVNSLDAANTWIQLSPDVLYLDFRLAIDNANLLGRRLQFHYLTERLSFDAKALRKALTAGGLTAVNRKP